MIFIYQVISYIHNRSQWYFFIKWCLTYTTGPSDISLSSDVLHTQQVPVIFIYQVMSYLLAHMILVLFYIQTCSSSAISLSTLVLLIYVFLWFIPLKLELLTQFRGSNDEQIFLLMENRHHQNLRVWLTLALKELHNVDPRHRCSNEAERST